MSKNTTGSDKPAGVGDQESQNKPRRVSLNVRKRGGSRGKLRLLTIAGALPSNTEFQDEDIELALGDETLPKAAAYDSNEFSIPASDGRGMKERRWVEMQPGYVNQIGAILASKSFPYRSEQALIRHAIHRHLRYLLTLEPQIPNHVSILEAINRIVSTQEMMLEVADLIGRVDRNVNDLTRRGMRSEAVRMVFDLKKKIQTMNEDRDGVWRGKLLSDIDERFGHLLKGGKRVSLLPHEERLG